ncbi:MAG TPA: TraR/DksA family transcriptional regulator [Acidiferrobacterales bacterium]|nr:TraR/DksA family transcriptional regulator [Acidiferrobacterales bacterium]
MPSLTPAEIQKIKQHLEQRRQQLIQEIHADRVDPDNKNFSDMAGRVRDPGDESLAIQLSDFNISAAEKRTTELSQVEAALQRIKEGTYGKCADCGGDIPPERLEVYPTAERCTYCQMRWENMCGGGRDVTPSL